MAENNDSIIDLTSSSSSFNFTLANHNRLNNIIINLDTDDSFREEENHESSSTIRTRALPMRARHGRKRRLSKTRTADVGLDPQVPVHDLCTPDYKNKKRSKDSKKQSKNIDTGEEPEEKKTKLALGPCPICFDDLGRQPLASTKCGHVFCLQCLKEALRTTPRCPICCTKLNGKSGYHNLYLS